MAIMTNTGDQCAQDEIKKAIWVAHSLFARNKVSGSTANLSFKCDNKLYITSSGSCFGSLSENDFSVMSQEGTLLQGRKPSKELPLHQILYARDKEIKAVLHTHSFYSVLWSMEKHDNRADCVPDWTPYLKMQLGTVGLVDYEKPGSTELFAAFEKVVKDSDGYILKNHGPVVGGKDIMQAFYIIEELEESCRMAWHRLHFA